MIRASLIITIAWVSGAHAQPIEPGEAASAVAPSVEPASGVRRLYDSRNQLRYLSGLRLPIVGDSTEAARQAAAHHLGFDKNELVFKRTLTAHGTQVFRFDHVVDGLTVLGGSVVVRTVGGQIESMISHAGSRTLSGEVQTEAPLRAAAAVTQWIGARSVEGWLAAFDTGQQLRRAWLVEVHGALHQKALVVFDAETGEQLVTWDLVEHGRGRVYNPNPVVTPEPETVELPEQTSARFLTGRYVRAASCQPSGVSECVVEQRAMADMSGDFLYEPEDPAYDDEFSEVNVFFHTNLIAEYFRETHGLEWNLL